MAVPLQYSVALREELQRVSLCVGALSHVFEILKPVLLPYCLD